MFQSLNHFLCCTLGSTWFAKDFRHFFVPFKLCFSGSSTGEDGGEVLAKVGEVHAVGNEFGDDFTPCYEVDQGDVFHLQEVATQEGNEFAHGGVVAHHLRHAEEPRFKCRCARGYECCCGMSE